MNGVLLRVAYDGAAFHGWAAQTGVRTVEETLRGALLAIDPGAGALRGASRTDAGVHAEAQPVAFDSARGLPMRGWVLALNQHLPEDVAVRSARPVAAGFAPRFAARWKRYRYRVLVDPVRDPLLRQRAWRIGGPIDVARMAREAASAVGTHDFGAFRSTSDARPSAVRTVTRLAIEPHGRLLDVVVEGTAFLHNMVRILAGTLVEVGLGRRAEGTMGRALASRQRRDAGLTAPAHGLSLEHVEIDFEGAAPPAGEDASWPP
jgi:tRNA pseudouridine38-40 synthase